MNKGDKNNKKDKEDKKDKVKVELDRNVANELIKMKEVGDTYSDVIKRLMGRRR